MAPVHLEETLSLRQGKDSGLLLCSLPAQPDVAVVSTDSRGEFSSVPLDAEVTRLFAGILGELRVWKVTI